MFSWTADLASTIGDARPLSGLVEPVGQPSRRSWRGVVDGMPGGRGRLAAVTDAAYDGPGSDARWGRS